MKIRGLMLVVALLGAPEALSAQRSHSRAEGAESDRHGPVEMLLRRREQIGLSAEQVARLEVIGRRMEEKNRPLVARLLEMRRELRSDFQGSPREMDPPRREEYRRRMKAARPLLREIRENNRAAMREVGGVLTERQKDEVRRMLRRDDHDGDRGDRGRGDDERRRRGGGH